MEKDKVELKRESIWQSINHGVDADNEFIVKLFCSLHIWMISWTHNIVFPAFS